MRTNPDDAVYGALNRVGEVENISGGLTKREIFALEAMKARLGNVSMYDRHGAAYAAVAHDAVGWADATIKALNEPIPESEVIVPIINNEEQK